LVGVAWHESCKDKSFGFQAGDLVTGHGPIAAAISYPKASDLIRLKERKIYDLVASD
jgi:hypothetical protein